MSLIEFLLIAAIALLAGILFTIRSILRLMREDRAVGHINTINHINEAVHRLSGHEGDELAPQILRALEEQRDLLSEVERSTTELRFAPWRDRYLNAPYQDTK